MHSYPLSTYGYVCRYSLTCHKFTHRGSTLVIFVLPVDLVLGDGGADWVTEQQATGEQRTDRVEKRESRVRDRNV